MTSKLTKSQKKVFGPRFFTAHGMKMKIIAKVRHDDQCGNGHNTFSIVADIHRESAPGSGVFVFDSGGCCHERVAEHFPELRHMIKWHLVSTDGPMHYPGNVLYHAGDRDHRGLREGEEKPLLTGGKPGAYNYHWSYEGKAVRSSYDLPKPTDGAEIKLEAKMTMIVGEGKERNLKAARNCAVWPEATDEELMSDDLEDRLKERLPGLMEEFRRDVEALGFVY